MIRHYVVSAFPERREALAREMRSAGLCPIVLEAPLGRAVEKTDPDLRAHPLWRDPAEKRLMTWGELACFAGHRKAWRAVAESGCRGAVILEDDARFAAQPLSGDHFKLPQDMTLDVLLLGSCEQRARQRGRPGAREFDGRAIHEAPYSYWAVGYYVTDEAARKLADAADSGAARAIPVDEWLPWHCGELPAELDPGGLPDSAGLNCWSVDTPVVAPAGLPSGTEAGGCAFALKTAVFATDSARAARTLDAYAMLGHDVSVLGEGEPPWDTSREGGRPKLEWLRDWLRDQPANAIVLASDGYDVEPSADAEVEVVLERYARMGRPLVVGGEARCWPERGLRERLDALPAADGEQAAYRYPCSGLLAGDAGTLADELDAMLADEREADDQALVQRAALERPERWRVDREARLFGHAGGAEADYDAGRNMRTGHAPLILHRNGPRKKRGSLPGWQQPRLSLGPVRELEPGGSGIHARRVLSARDAAEMAGYLDSLDGWQPLEGDSVPGDELRLASLSEGLRARWAEALEAAWNGWLANAWAPARPGRTRDLFAIRYSAGGQAGIEPHCDASWFSGSLVLRRAERGGLLRWERQGADDGALEPGMMAVWPAPITHPHGVTAVESGQRVSLVWWTEKKP